MENIRWMHRLHMDIRVGLFIAGMDYEDFVKIV